MVEQISLVIRISTISLLVVQLLHSVIRGHKLAIKAEGLLFSTILIIFVIKLLFPEFTELQVLSTIALLFASGNYFLLVLQYRGRGIFSILMAGFFIVCLGMDILGNQNTVLFTIYFIISSTMSSIFCLYLFFQFQAWLGRMSIRILFAAVVITSASALVMEIVPPSPPSTPSTGAEIPVLGILFLFITLIISYFLFEEKYLSEACFTDFLLKLEEKERREKEIFNRLEVAEASMMEKENLVSLGVLTAGLLHEFKNIIHLIKLCAESGIESSSKEKMTLCLVQIKENTEIAMESVISVLESIRSDKQLKPSLIDSRDFLLHFLKLIKANYRNEGIEISGHLEQFFKIEVRKGDLEQIMLNLVRNAAAELSKKKAGTDKKLIMIQTRIEGQIGILEVADNAGGIPDERAVFLFDQPGKSKESTGIGLYLSRLLARQNNGDIRYSVSDSGSVFTITFPLSDKEQNI